MNARPRVRHRQILASLSFALCLASSGSPAGADVIHLKNGATLAADAWEVSGDLLIISQGASRINVPRSQVDRIDPAPQASPTPAATPSVTASTPVPPSPAPARREPPAESTAPASGADFASALRRLDQGDTTGAARTFESFILAAKPDRFTLQVMIACQEDTVRGARTRAGEDGSLFILPYSLKGRSCYRVCWGLYPDGESARAAVSAVPAALTGPGVPLVVPLSRLRSPG